MKTAVKSGAERIHLDLSVAEFGMLLNLTHNHLGGTSLLRTAIQDGFNAVCAGLSEENRERVRDAARLTEVGEGWNSERIAALFQEV